MRREAGLDCPSSESESRRMSKIEGGEERKKKERRRKEGRREEIVMVEGWFDELVKGPTGIIYQAVCASYRTRRRGWYVDVGLQQGDPPDCMRLSSTSLSGYPYSKISEISRSVLPVGHIVHVQSYTTPCHSTPTMAHPFSQ